MKNTLIKFEKEGKKSYFDYKDGRWQFWGDLEVDDQPNCFLNH